MEASATSGGPDLTAKIDAVQAAAAEHYAKVAASGELLHPPFVPPHELDEVESFIEMLTRRICEPTEHESLRNSGVWRFTLERGDSRAFHVPTFVWSDTPRDALISNLDSRRGEIAAYVKGD